MPLRPDCVPTAFPNDGTAVNDRSRFPLGKRSSRNTVNREKSGTPSSARERRPGTQSKAVSQQDDFSDPKAPALLVAERRIQALEKALARAESADKRDVRGNSGDPTRGTWCTPKPLAEAVGPFDIDPFSNPRSHIVSTRRAMLEDGGDGFGTADAGSYRSGPAPHGYGVALAETRVWLQPPYAKGFVQRAFDHYRHTRFTALLRFDPRPPWWHAVYNASELVAVIAVEFEPPPGVKDRGGNSYPHALYYRRAEDVTEAVLRMAAAVWRKKAR